MKFPLALLLKAFISSFLSIQLELRNTYNESSFRILPASLLYGNKLSDFFSMQTEF